MAINPRITGCAGIASTLVLGVAAPGGVADAGNLIVPTSCASVQHYQFSSDTEWTTARKDIVRAGVELWNGIVDRWGDQLVDVDESSAGDYVTLQWDDLADGTYAQTGHAGELCEYAATDITFNTDFIDDFDDLNVNYPAFLKGVAGHEMGHALGLDEIAWNEDDYSLLSTDPLMGTCIETSSLSTFDGVLSNDDAAHLQLAHSVWNVDEISLISNPGFEMLFKFWKYGGTSTAALSWSTTDPLSGNRKVIFTGGESDYLATATRWVTNGASTSSGLHDMRASVDTSYVSSGDSGDVTVGLYAREVSYETTAENPQCNIDGTERDQPETPLEQFVLLDDASVTPSTEGWYGATTDIVSVLDDWTAWTVKIEITSSVEDSGNEATGVELDDAWVQLCIDPNCGDS